MFREKAPSLVFSRDNGEALRINDCSAELFLHLYAPLRESFVEHVDIPNADNTA